MLQKDKLGQDMMLLGRPGRLRRHLVMQYAELTRREVEYVLLNRDTTESDLKQRREIRDGTATYHNQGAVRAATEGRLLVIEGVEKAERNVLPILNNLLENREMHLEDGRFLISAKNYDSLRQVRMRRTRRKRRRSTTHAHTFTLYPFYVPLHSRSSATIGSSWTAGDWCACRRSSAWWHSVCRCPGTAVHH